MEMEDGVMPLGPRYGATKLKFPEIEMENLNLK
jgi:hypothetical protein